MTTQASDTRIILRNVRLSYAQLFTPKADDNGNLKYSVTCLIPKTDKDQVAKIKAAIEAAKKKDAAKIGTGASKNPLLDGDAQEDGVYKYKGEENRGHYLLRTSTQNKPGVVDQNVQPILDQSEVYSGCFANVSVNFYGYNSKTNKGVAPGLNNVQKVKDGEPLSGGPRADDEFSAIDNEDVL